MAPDTRMLDYATARAKATGETYAVYATSGEQIVLPLEAAETVFFYDRRAEVLAIVEPKLD